MQLGGEELYQRCLKENEYGDIRVTTESLKDIGLYIKEHPEKRQETLDYIEKNLFEWSDNKPLFMAAYKADYCEDDKDLKKFYGLKVSIEEGDYASGDKNTAKRLEFDSMVSSIDDEEYYKLLHTEEFLTFKPDKRKKYKWMDYTSLEDESSAFKTLKKYNFDSLLNVAVDSFIKNHVPPEKPKTLISKIYVN